jgi:hypothetical protein
LVLDAAKGEVIKRHALRTLVLAMNPSWDFRYIGAQEISDADGNRLLNKFVTMPPEEIERAILLKYCKDVDGFDLPTATLDKIMAIAKDIRNMTDTGQLAVSWGLRPQLAVSSLTEDFDLEECYRLAITDRLDQSEGGPAHTIMGAVKTRI